MSRRNAPQVTRFAHPGAIRGNCANHEFHLRQAAVAANGLLSHLIGAERSNTGCTGGALEQLQGLMNELAVRGARCGLMLDLRPPEELRP